MPPLPRRYLLTRRDHTLSPAEQHIIAEMLATVARLGGAAPDGALLRPAQTMSARAKTTSPRASAQAGAISS